MSLDLLMEVLRNNAANSEQRRQEGQATLANMMSQSIQQDAMAQQEALQQAAVGKITPTGGGDRGSVGAVGTPGKFGSVNPHAGMATLKFNGMSFQVNKTAASRFQGFLNALSKTGYKINSIGGYSNRNIAGTNTKSLHSYGLAIDINPGANPVTYGSIKTDLPKGVGKLAAKYGLTWGGNWNGSKKDTMHFSIPMFGTK